MLKIKDAYIYIYVYFHIHVYSNDDNDDVMMMDNYEYIHTCIYIYRYIFIYLLFLNNYTYIYTLFLYLQFTNRQINVDLLNFNLTFVIPPFLGNRFSHHRVFLWRGPSKAEQRSQWLQSELLKLFLGGVS